MSLMFAALRRLDAPASVPRAAVPARVARRWLALAWPTGLVSCAFVAGWWLAPARDAASPRQVAQAAAVEPSFAEPSLAPRPATPMPTPAAAPITMRPVAPARNAVPAQATSPVLAAAMPGAPRSETVAGMQPAAPAVDANPPRVAAAAADPQRAPVPAVAKAAGAPSRPVSQPVAAPQPAAFAEAAPPAPLPQEGLSVRDASPAGEGGEARAIAREVAMIGDAINARDFDGARTRLQALARQLPPRSLTLMRMQAWLAHESGDSGAALALYREIVARVPGDRTSVVNLAILEAAHGEADKARERLRRLREVDSSSLEVQQAIANVEAELQ